MDSSKIAKFDDNTLFRFLSKSYSKSRSKTFLQPPDPTHNLSATNYFKRPHSKLKKQSPSLYNTFCKSLSISQNHSNPRPGFLKYRNFSINDAVPLNSSIQTPKKSLLTLSNNLKTAELKDFKDFRRSICDFDTDNKRTQQFGLRNIVKKVKHDFRYPEDRLRNNQTATQTIEYEMLCSKSKKMFSGNKNYNLNSFLMAENGKGLSKKGKSRINSSVLKRKAGKICAKEMNATLG